MARDNVPCSRFGCRSAAEWLAWYNGERPIALCYRCMKLYYRTIDYAIIVPNIAPILVGVN